MGFFSFLTADKREKKLMNEKTSRAIAIVVSYTAPEELGEDVGANFGKVLFKLRKEQTWEQFEVILREDVGANFGKVLGHSSRGRGRNGCGRSVDR